MANILQTIQPFVTIIKKHIVWILIVSIAAGALGGLYKKREVVLYKAKSRIFPINSGDPSGFNAIKSQLGVGGGAGNDLSKIYNLQVLSKSRTILRKVVNCPANNNKHNTIGDWLQEDYNKRVPKKLKITTTDSISKNNELSTIFGSSLIITTENTDFTQIATLSGNADLSIRMNECLLQCLSDFYINSKTEKARTDIYKIGIIKDSFKGVLDALELRIAGMTDNSQYIIKEVANLPKVKLMNLHEEVFEAYKTSLEAYQNANFKLVSESPIFQVLDQPTKPVEALIPAWKKFAAVVFVSLFFLLLIIVLSKLIYNVILTELSKDSEA